MVHLGLIKIQMLQFFTGVQVFAKTFGNQINQIVTKIPIKF